MRVGRVGRVTGLAALSLAVGAVATAAGVTAAIAAGPEPWEIDLQPAASTSMHEMAAFHDLLLWVIAAICLFVLALIGYVALRFNAKANPTPSRTAHNTLIEVAWTIVPVLILLAIAVPSFRLLYYVDRTADPEMTLIAHGYQWYWGYEYPDQQIAEFESRLVPEAKLQPGQPRLLTTTAPVVLPIDTNIQILTTAGDVLHAWAVPPFGVKRDAVPGRINETWVRIEQEGTYYGQCSELCGTEHAFMPIEIRAVTRETFDQWVVEQAGPDPAAPPKLLTMTWEEALSGRRLAQAAAAP